MALTDLSSILICVSNATASNQSLLFQIFLHGDVSVDSIRRIERVSIIAGITLIDWSKE